jgi:anti-sigma regulatory factor (Ser/Thr protein kinase)
MPEMPPSNPPPIVLNEWAARELQAQPGHVLSMEYFLWEEPGQLVTRSTEFRVAAIVPIERGDRRMAPEYPGISDAASLVDWDPPFPLDLRKIRPADEEYWDKYTTTPKAFVPLQAGQQFWQSRYGALTSIRFASGMGNLERDLRAKVDPLAAGLSVINVREQSLDASRGATNFGEYFVYFSFFLVVSALLLAALFFKLSVEQRIREVGLLRAVGLPPSAVRRIFLAEGLVLSVAGALLGAAGAILYAGAIVSALRTLIIDVPERLALVWADADLLERVLQNLVDNSIKFTPVGGEIVIGVTADPDANSPAALVTISDSGTGIPPSLQAHIFDKFAGEKEKGGSGLGLAFCKTVLAAHSQDIWMESEPGEGTTFTFSLSLLPQHNPASQPVAA